MATVNVDWPSEDEDFDAVTTSKRGRRNVAVQANGEPDEVPESYQEAEQPVEATQTAPEVAEPELVEKAQTEEPAEEPYDEPEPAVDEAPVENVAPEQLEPVPPVAPPASKRPKLPGNQHPAALARLAFEVVLVALVVGLALYAWTLSSDKKNLHDEVSSLKNNPQAVVQQQTDQLIKQVGGLINLPQGEQPTVANVSDAAQAKQQSAFFNNAQNGDKVLMYVKAGEAILYRPSTNKIILVAPLTFNNNTAAATTPSASATQKTNSTTNVSNGTTSTNKTTQSTTTGR